MIGQDEKVIIAEAKRIEGILKIINWRWIITASNEKEYLYCGCATLVEIFIGRVISVYTGGVRSLSRDVPSFSTLIIFDPFVAFGYQNSASL